MFSRHYFSTCISFASGMWRSQASLASHRTLRLADDAAVYASSVVDETTQFWRLLHQSTGVPLPIVIILDVLPRVSQQLA